MNQQINGGTLFLGFSQREILCFSFALMVHSLLFLWKGGTLDFLLQGQGDGLGESLVQVGFLNEAPNWDEPAAGGGGTEVRSKGLLARVKSLFKQEPAGQNPAKNKELAMGQTTKFESSEKDLFKGQAKFEDKSFANKKGFQGLLEKKENMDIAVGASKDIAIKPSQGNFEQAAPNLQQKALKIAKNDVPFPILKPKQPDALANVNAIAIPVGRTTSDSIKSLDGGPGAGEALQSKTLASKGFQNAGGFAGMGKSRSGGSGGDGDESLGSFSKGESAPIAGIGGSGFGSGSGTGIGNGSGTGSGYGSGSGTGAGHGSGHGTGRGTGAGGGGRAWGGSGTGRGTTLAVLPRNRVDVAAADAGFKPQSSGFHITGALTHRPILQKFIPTYEMDGRIALRFRVDSNGKVMDGIIVEISSGSPTFDQKVSAALKKWLFSRLPASRANELQEGVITFVFKGV